MRDKQLLRPPYIRVGDSITLVSTARKIAKNELEAAVKLFESWGLTVNFGENIFEENHQFAGTKTARRADFQRALNDSNCKAIICARGGYGTVQIIDKLDFSKFKNSPKWIVGYSDVTVLHAHINQNFNCETLHATMPINFPKMGENEAIRSLRAALFGENSCMEFMAQPTSVLPKNLISAPLVGGNLSILYSLSGSNSQLNTKDKMLFIEDLDEYLYHIDRMMVNLRRSGLLNGCRAILVGGMNAMKDNAIPYGKSAEEIILENTLDLNIPVIFGLPAGHIEENRALILNRNYQLSVKENLVKLQADGRT